MTTAPVRPGSSLSEDLDEQLADIGDRVRAERKARGWSQQKLGKRAGLTLATVKRLEAGRPTLVSNLVLACRGLGVGMGHLLSAQWSLPERQQGLLPLQRRVLAAVADGKTLAAAGLVLGMSQGRVGGELSRAYQRLGVSHLPRDERRAAAVRVARERKWIDVA